MENYLLTCEIHEGEILTKFCQDHRLLCCSKCIDHAHRPCTQVTGLSQIKQQSLDVTKLSVRISNTLSRLKKLKRYREDNMKSIQGSHAELGRNMVETMRLDIEHFLVKCEDTSKNKPKNEHYLVYEMRQKIYLILAEFNDTTVKEMKEELTIKQAPLIRVINTCIRYQYELLRLSEAIQKPKNQPELKVIAYYKCLDIIQQSEIYMNENFSDEVFSVQRMSEHKVKQLFDSYACSIIGICVLPNGQILILDKRNKKVKLLDHQFQVVNHWSVTSCPWDMCQITPSEVAVTVDENNTHMVQFIKVKESQLVPVGKLQFHHKCKGLTHSQGDLFICSVNSLYKYSLDGKRVCRLYEDKSDTVWKCAVSPLGDKLYISNNWQSKLLTLARDGTVLAIFTDPELLYTYGLHVTPTGQVLVCGYQSHTLLQVNNDGSRKIATLATRERDGLVMPQSVCYSSTTSSIIVGQFGGNNILVFRVE
ncbi:hypothetical protein DPMN_075243 [Dreissena polymorpha]|uniref:B box-type domain-containing protein n=2 Tax=Dreissena polymorpha TaxID=45954 RepID=A0A9D3YK45_DREPO|nr:hypothetical protein DPMN_075243 [Dreissena polymorpha]